MNCSQGMPCCPLHKTTSLHGRSGLECVIIIQCFFGYVRTHSLRNLSGEVFHSWIGIGSCILQTTGICIAYSSMFIGVVLRFIINFGATSTCNDDEFLSAVYMFFPFQGSRSGILRFN
jgi:hypothetical protein